MGMILDKRFDTPMLDVAWSGSSLEEPALATRPSSRMRTITTTRFGTLEVEEDLIITLPEGLIGFETCTQFVVVRHDENSAFRWLQSLDEPGMALPVLEPREFRPDYAPMISDADARFLSISAKNPPLVFVIITVPANNPRAMTANLLGPIVINALTRIGKQVIVQDTVYTTRHDLVEELKRASEMPAAETT
jgi:flagellar assembly factor FliW